MPGNTRSRKPRGRAHLYAAAVSLLAVSGCEVPTGLPKWDTTWIVPAQDVFLSVSELLPASVTTTPENTAFLLELPSVTFSRTLGELCPECRPFSGLVVPKPAFTVSFSGEVELPEDVVSVALSQGAVEVRLSHDFSFDPLRPSATARGFAVLSVSSGETVLAQDTIRGTETAFPPNTVLTRTLALDAAAVAGPVTVSVTVNSPAGDPVRVDTNDRLTVVAAPGQIGATEARIEVEDQAVTLEEVELDLEDIEADVVDNVQSGALLLEIENPFELAGVFDVVITAPGVRIVRSVEVGAGTTEARVGLSAEELQSILGKAPVELSVTGRVSAPSGAVTVRPSQVLVIHSRFEVVLAPAPEEV